MDDFLLCSDCFKDEGLRLVAADFGKPDSVSCPNCHRISGHKLTKKLIERVVHRFFVWGSLHLCKYGGAPIIQANAIQKTSVKFAQPLQQDVELLEKAIGVGFFRYGPRLWMIGNNSSLKGLQDDVTRPAIIQKISTEYPARILPVGTSFYRIRKAPADPKSTSEYDAPPRGKVGNGRFDDPTSPIMYCSENLQVCVHECRFSADDTLYVAKITANRPLRLLDLTALLLDNGTNEHDSLDMAVHMLFLAGPHSFEISREIAAAARQHGFDGINYPSFFSNTVLGTMPLETNSGLSYRMFESMKAYEESKNLPNLAIFGRPVADGLVDVKCINRLIIRRVAYDFHFGPASYD